MTMSLSCEFKSLIYVTLILTKCCLLSSLSLFSCGTVIVRSGRSKFYAFVCFATRNLSQLPYHTLVMLLHNSSSSRPTPQAYLCHTYLAVEVPAIIIGHSPKLRATLLQTLLTYSPIRCQKGPRLLPGDMSSAR